MPPDPACFSRLNVPPATPFPTNMSSFTLSAPPNTDLWRKPPSRDTSTAPILYTSLRHPFVAAEVAISADWELEWDQAGLVIFAGAPPTQRESQQQALPVVTADGLPPTYATSVPSSRTPASKWVKAGLEFCGGRCNASSVCATSDGADWALAPLSPTSPSPSTSTGAMNRSMLRDDRSEMRVKLERVGYALWIWFEDPTITGPLGHGYGWKKLREVTWFFWGVEDKAVRIGVYACRPANFGGMMWDSRRHMGVEVGPGSGNLGLEVEFDGLEIF